MTNAHLKDPDVYSIENKPNATHVCRNNSLLARLFTFDDAFSEDEAQHIAEYIVKYLQDKEE